MTPKTDLTENREFSRIPQRTFVFDVVSSEELGEMLNMTNEKYDRIHGWERIFGKKYHTSERYRIFDDEERYMCDMKTHCLRCGVALRIPWRNNDGLCVECARDLDRDFNKLPWRNPKIQPRENPVSEDDERTKMDLFGLR